jgi:nucleolar complex protein 3
MVLLEKELLEASAEENKTRKSKCLTQITNIVFTIYFRILKHDEVNESLLSAVLEGLSK